MISRRALIFLILACLAFAYAAWLKLGEPGAIDIAPTATFGAEQYSLRPHGLAVGE